MMADGVQWIVAVVSKRGDNNDYTLRFYSVSSDIPQLITGVIP